MQCCLDLPEPKLHKKITCAMFAHNPQTTLHRKIVVNFVWIYLGVTLCDVGPWLRNYSYKRKTIYRILYRSCWDNIAYKYCLVNVAQLRLWQHCTKKLLVHCWARANRHTFAGKPAVLNMSGSLFFNRVQFFVQCWLGSSFTACGTTLNRGWLWLEHLNQNYKKNHASHRHCMMTKKLKLAIHFPVNPWCTECNADWFYCEKPFPNKTKLKYCIPWKKTKSSW